MTPLRRRRRLEAIAAALAIAVSIFIGCSGGEEHGSAGSSLSTSSGSGEGGSSGSVEPVGPAGSGGSYGFTLCATREDCPPDEECARYECAEQGVCILTYAFQGKAVNLSPSDCTSVLCGPSGTIQSTEIEDSEIPPDDLDECTEDTCSNGAPAYIPMADGSPCEGGTKQCKGGQCASIACQAVGDCPAALPCVKASCASGSCAYAPEPAGTPAGDISSSDCVQTACDGAGGQVEAEDPDDMPTDNDPCTDDACVGKVPTFTAAQDGTTCGAGMYCYSGGCSQCGVDANCQNPCITGQSCFFGECKFGSQQPNGTSCNGGMFCYNGGCSQCGVDANCPAVTCKVRTCNAGACQYANAPNGTSCGFLKTCQNGQCV